MGHINLEIPIALLRARAFLRPVTTTTTSLASITVCTPTVNAILGTFSMSLSKKRAFAKIVSYARVLMRVREVKDEPVRDKVTLACHSQKPEIPTWFIKSNMAVLANTREEQFYSSSFLDRSFVCLALPN
jgi:hypothetical protein